MTDQDLNQLNAALDSEWGLIGELMARRPVRYIGLSPIPNLRASDYCQGYQTAKVNKKGESNGTQADQ